jgi:hypothetical protein
MKLRQIIHALQIALWRVVKELEVQLEYIKELLSLRRKEPLEMGLCLAFGAMGTSGWSEWSGWEKMTHSCMLLNVTETQ